MCISPIINDTSHSSSMLEIFRLIVIVFGDSSHLIDICTVYIYILDIYKNILWYTLYLTLVDILDIHTFFLVGGLEPWNFIFSHSGNVITPRLGDFDDPNLTLKEMGVASFANGLQLSAKAWPEKRDGFGHDGFWVQQKTTWKIWKHEWFVAVNRC